MYRLVYDVAWVSLGWGIMNLLPILPLDGGRVTVVLLHRLNVEDAERLARLISVGAALGLAIWAWHAVGFLMALWAMFFAVSKAAAVTRQRV